MLVLFEEEEEELDRRLDFLDFLFDDLDLLLDLEDEEEALPEEEDLLRCRDDFLERLRRRVSSLWCRRWGEADLERARFDLDAFRCRLDDSLDEDTTEPDEAGDVRLWRI